MDVVSTNFASIEIEISSNECHNQEGEDQQPIETSVESIRSVALGFVLSLGPNRYPIVAVHTEDLSNNEDQGSSCEQAYTDLFDIPRVDTLFLFWGRWNNLLSNILRWRQGSMRLLWQYRTMSCFHTMFRVLQNILRMLVMVIDRLGILFR